MLQPQSDDEIRWVVEELQRLDPLLDIRWDPKHVLVETGSYSAIGKRVDATYDGRWQVIRHQPSELNDRDYVVICTLTEPQREGGLLVLVKDGPYAPVGEWVLELMRSADAQNVEQFRKIREKLWAQSDAAEASRGRSDEGGLRDAFDRNAFNQNYAGGRGRWHGQGADFDATGRMLSPSH
jgi:hypothetical protein